MTSNLYVFSITPLHATDHTRFILFDLMALTTSGKEHNCQALIIKISPAPCLSRQGQPSVTVIIYSPKKSSELIQHKLPHQYFKKLDSGNKLGNVCMLLECSFFYSSYLSASHFYSVLLNTLRGDHAQLL